jgi:hypothetical protein
VGKKWGGGTSYWTVPFSFLIFFVFSCFFPFYSFVLCRYPSDILYFMCLCSLLCAGVTERLTALAGRTRQPAWRWRPTAAASANPPTSAASPAAASPAGGSAITTWTAGQGFFSSNWHDLLPLCSGMKKKSRNMLKMSFL